MKDYCLYKHKDEDRGTIRGKIRERLVLSYVSEKPLDVLISELEKGRYLTSIKKFWSVSYSTNCAVGILSKNRVGIDVETITKRDAALLDTLPDGVEKTWKMFYRIWTAKEASLKAYNLDFDQIEDITYIKHDTLTTTLLLSSGETVICFVYFVDKCIISICEQKNYD